MKKYTITSLFAGLILFSTSQYWLPRKLLSNHFFDNNSTKAAVAATRIDCPQNLPPLGKVEEIQGTGLRINRNGQERLSVGDFLCSNEKVKTESDTDLFIRCYADNERRKLAPGLELEIDYSCPMARICQEGQVTCERGGGSNQITEANSPHIISPRNTALLNPEPRFRWHIPGAKSYTVRLERDGEEDVIWSTKVEEAKIFYPFAQGEKALKPGPSYTLIVIADNNQSAEARFSLFESNRISLVEEPIQNIPLYKKYHYLPLYKKYHLTAEAIELLEELIEQGDRSAVIHRELGDLYRKIGLIYLAEESYTSAVELAESANNTKGEALACARLGDLYRIMRKPDEAERYLERAKELYKESGD